MAGRMRALDWSATALGDPQNWPGNLCVAVSLCLTSRIPIVMYWGAKFSVLYNDEYISFLGDNKHPRFLGSPGDVCWREIWETIGPMLEGVRATGKATWSQDLLMFFARRLPLEEVYVRFTFGPLLAADGQTVDGIFCPCTETTERVVGERRLETLRRLGVQAAQARTVVAACQELAEVLAANPYDIPFAAIYVAEGAGTQARLAACVGVPENDHPFPSLATCEDGDGSSWPLSAVLRTHRAEEISDLGAVARLPGGPWPDTASRAIVLPIFGATHESLYGLLLAGVSSRRILDPQYRSFLELVAGHIGTAIADALAYEAERKRAEALAEIDRAKTLFFSNISHELRTPLTLLLGPLENLLAGGKEAVWARRDDLELMRRNGLRLLKLVNNLLDFSRIEAGRVRAVFEPVPLDILTADLASVFRSAFERGGIALKVEAQALSQPVYVDRDMWEKIVMNLLSNAFKFTLEGEVTVSLTEAGARAVLQVRDTGAGIPPEELPNLFKRFHRVPGAKARTHEGTGIGLALVQELVKLLGGSVTVESVYRKGSVFTISIPFGHHPLPEEPIGASRTLESTATAADLYVEESLSWLGKDEVAPLPASRQNAPAAVQAEKLAAKGRVLLADDNADMREYVQRLLSESYEVRATTNGKTALEAALADPPDLVLTDIMMPELDGLGLLQALRADARTATIPVILLSARAGEEPKVEGMRTGADDYLIKPFSARELLARVGAHLEMSRLRKQFEERLRQAAKLESLGILAGGIAHDFNNLLASILGNASLLLEGQPDPVFSRAAAENIVEASERAAHLTRQMLDYAGKNRSVVQRLDLSKQIPAIAALVSASIPKYVEVRFDLRDGSFIEADPGQLQQIVMNLVINGAEAIGPDGGSGEISVSTMTVTHPMILDILTGSLPPARYVVLQVRDTGQGMDEQTKAQIFDPFFTTKFAGRGLGLAAVLGIIKNHGAGLRVDSVPGKGTTFQVLFPFAAGVDQVGPADVARVVRGSGTILVVDDELAVRKFVKAALERDGYTVLLAENGSKAVELFIQNRDQIRAVLLDLAMPVMSGQEALKQLRDIRADIPVIASSGYSEENTRKQLGDGLRGFLQKPYRVDRLREVVRRVFDSTED